MKLVWRYLDVNKLIIVFIAVHLLSCSNSDMDINKIFCDVRIESVRQYVKNNRLKTTYIKRGNAPLTIDGFNIKVENLDFPSVGAIEEDFVFNESGGDDVLINYVFEGLNRFTAESFGGTPRNGWYEVAKAEGNTGAEKSDAYGLLLAAEYPEYILFKDTVEKEIVPNILNSLSFNMKPENGRLAVVLENNNRTFKVEIYVNGDLRTVSYRNNACYLLNDNSPDGTQLNIKIDEKKGNKIVRTIERTEILEVGKNKTLFIDIR